MAGKEVIEGQRMMPSGYAQSKRKIRRWVKQGYALVGVSYAAKIIQDRLSPSFVIHRHCHHCSWILYLSGLVCWAFGFTLTGTMHNDGLVQKGKIVSLTQARQQCDDYLAIATMVDMTGLEIAMNDIGKTTGLLVTLVDVLENDCGSGLIAEAVEVLKRLVGIDEEPLVEIDI
ncbi:hypothetical protein BP6252_05962 [Coleophoma cylindrospora]|uniref:Uncharacterized protein n=1 Tax=Coleophoma cylindrospora TaxID=1849047 RepID=A0A3D8RLJ1_9HELO|nr:hypothetical protein BP6252_05962 [Coleophoma cylindrospora]